MANKRALGKKEDNDLNLHKKLSSMMTKERYCELLPDDCWWFSQGHELTLHTQLSEIGNSLLFPSSEQDNRIASGIYSRISIVYNK